MKTNNGKRLIAAVAIFAMVACENERAPASGRGRDAGAKREEVSLY